VSGTVPYQRGERSDYRLLTLVAASRLVGVGRGECVAVWLRTEDAI